MPSRAFVLDFLEKKEDKRERKGVKRKGRKARLCPFYCEERCGRNLLERERGKRPGEAMPSCAFLLDFLEKKEDKRKRKGEKRKGRKARLCPVIARNVVRETC